MASSINVVIYLLNVYCTSRKKSCLLLLYNNSEYMYPLDKSIIIIYLKKQVSSLREKDQAGSKRPAETGKATVTASTSKKSRYTQQSCP